MLNDPTWSYGNSVIINSHDLGLDHQPAWSYGTSLLIGDAAVTVDVYGVMFSYGQSVKSTSESKTFEPGFSYGLSQLYHDLERVAGRIRARLRGTHTWVSKTLMRKGRIG